MSYSDRSKKKLDLENRLNDKPDLSLYEGYDDLAQASTRVMSTVAKVTGVNRKPLTAHGTVLSPTAVRSSARSGTFSRAPPQGLSRSTVNRPSASRIPPQLSNRTQVRGVNPFSPSSSAQPGHTIRGTLSRKSVVRGATIRGSSHSQQKTLFKSRPSSYSGGTLRSPSQHTAFGTKSSNIEGNSNEKRGTFVPNRTLLQSTIAKTVHGPRNNLYTGQVGSSGLKVKHGSGEITYSLEGGVSHCSFGDMNEFFIAGPHAHLIPQDIMTYYSENSNRISTYDPSIYQSLYDQQTKYLMPHSKIVTKVKDKKVDFSKYNSIPIFTSDVDHYFPIPNLDSELCVFDPKSEVLESHELSSVVKKMNSIQAAYRRKYHLPSSSKKSGSLETSSSKLSREELAGRSGGVGLRGEINLHSKKTDKNEKDDEESESVEEDEENKQKSEKSKFLAKSQDRVHNGGLADFSTDRRSKRRNQLSRDGNGNYRFSGFAGKTNEECQMVAKQRKKWPFLQSKKLLSSVDSFGYTGKNIGNGPLSEQRGINRITHLISSPVSEFDFSSIPGRIIRRTCPTARVYPGYKFESLRELPAFLTDSLNRKGYIQKGSATESAMKTLLLGLEGVYRQGGKKGDVGLSLNPTEHIPPFIMNRCWEHVIEMGLHYTNHFLQVKQLHNAMYMAVQCRNMASHLVSLHKHFHLAVPLNINLVFSTEFNIGYVQHSLGLYDQALKTYHALLGPNYSNKMAFVRVNIGNIHYRRGEFAEASKQYKICLDSFSSQKARLSRSSLIYSLLSNISNTQLSQGRLISAIDTLETMANFVYIRDIPGLFNLLVAWFTVGDKGKMKQTFVTLLTLGDRVLEGLLAIGKRGQIPHEGWASNRHVLDRDSDEDLEDGKKKESEDDQSKIRRLKNKIKDQIIAEKERSNSGIETEESKLRGNSSGLLRTEMMELSLTADSYVHEQILDARRLLRSIDVAARLIAPHIENTVTAGYDWIINTVKTYLPNNPDTYNDSFFRNPYLSSKHGIQGRSSGYTVHRPKMPLHKQIRKNSENSENPENNVSEKENQNSSTSAQMAARAVLLKLTKERESQLAKHSDHVKYHSGLSDSTPISSLNTTLRTNQVISGLQGDRFKFKTTSTSNTIGSGFGLFDAATSFSDDEIESVRKDKDKGVSVSKLGGEGEIYSSVIREMMMNKGFYLIQVNDIHSAYKVFQELDTLMRNTVRVGGIDDMVSINLATLYMLEGKLDVALKKARASYQKDKYDVSVVVNLGNVYFLKDDLTTARSFYLEAVGLDSQHYEALYNLGLSLRLLNLHLEAHQSFLKLHSLYEDDCNVLLQLALVAIAVEDHTTAKQWLEMILLLRDDSSVLTLLGSLSANYQSQSKHHLDSDISHLYSNTNTNTNSHLNSQFNLNTEAVEIRLNSTHNQINFGHDNNSKPSEDDSLRQAIKYYQDADLISGTSLEILCALGVYSVKSNDFQRAIEYFIRASNIDLYNPKWLLMIASCYRRLGNSSAAYDTYLKAIELDPSCIEAYEYLISLAEEGNPRLTEFHQKLAELRARQKELREQEIIERQEAEEDSRYLAQPTIPKPSGPPLINVHVETTSPLLTTSPTPSSPPSPSPSLSQSVFVLPTPVITSPPPAASEIITNDLPSGNVHPSNFTPSPILPPPSVNIASTTTLPKLRPIGQSSFFLDGNIDHVDSAKKSTIEVTEADLDWGELDDDMLPS